MTMAKFSLSFNLLLLLGVSCGAQNSDEGPGADLISLCPSATVSSAWAGVTSCESSFVNQIFGAQPCAAFATQTDLGPKFASCNCELYKQIAQTCLPTICDSAALVKFSTSTLSGLCEATATGGEGEPAPTATGGESGPTQTAPTSTTSKGGAPEVLVPVAGGAVMGFVGALAALL